MLDRILHEFGSAADVQNFHDPVFVESDGPDSNLQNVSDVFNRPALRQELQDLPLPVSEVLWLIRRPRITNETLFHGRANLWRHVRLIDRTYCRI